jgi:hypothetical protein
MKYRHFVMVLENDQLYCPASIVDNAFRSGLSRRASKPDDYKKQRTRIRHTLARFSKNHDFPDMGDGMVRMPGQAPQRAWFGWRWKEALPRLTA